MVNLPADQPQLFLGIDAGSSVLKAGLFDAKGALVALANRPTPRSHPQAGWVEMDAEANLTALDDVIKELVAASPDPTAIAGIGLSAAMVGAWLLDAEGAVLRPGINWEDSRSQSLLDAMLAERPTLYRDIFQISGSVLQQGCTLPVIAWLRDHEPDRLARAKHVVTYKDVLRHHLTGTVASDRSETAVMPGDARAQDHSLALHALFGLDDHSHLFATALPSNAVAGHISAEASARTGLPKGVPVVAGAGDVIANVLGAGGFEAGRATAILGTTCMVGITRTEPVFTPPDLGLLFSLPERHWYRAMVNVAGTNNLDWALGLVAPELTTGADRFTQLTERVKVVPPGARGVTYLPYLSESGIIAPITDPHARAQFCGLHPGHTADDMLRAVFEGVAFAMDDLVRLLGLASEATIILAGGGARNPLWVQMIADICERAVMVPDGDELGAKGAAILAASGVAPDADLKAIAARMAGGGRVTKPTALARANWADSKARFARYRDRLLGRSPTSS
jgi:sugar (pentulose or hexulose) kinase